MALHGRRGRSHVDDGVDQAAPQQFDADPGCHPARAAVAAERSFRHVAGIRRQVIADVLIVAAIVAVERLGDGVFVRPLSRERADGQHGTLGGGCRVG